MPGGIGARPTDTGSRSAKVVDRTGSDTWAAMVFMRSCSPYFRLLSSNCAVWEDVAYCSTTVEETPGDGADAGIGKTARRTGIDLQNRTRGRRVVSTLNIGNFIWGIADDVLRDVYVRGKYRDVILPMTVIRRLDAVLEPTKEAVLRMKEQLDAAGITNQDSALCQASGQAFYNASPFRLRDLASRGRQQRLRADFEAYLDGFSPNVQEVLEKFRFRNQIPTLVEADALGFLLEKFLDGSVNLGPEPVRNEDGSVRLEGLDNHGMGTVFEELIRRFSEENNEEAGEHFTPRDVVQLMAHLVFLPVADAVKSGTYLVYDGACGTGGMLTVAEDTLTELAGKRGKEVSVHLYGQEVNPETTPSARPTSSSRGKASRPTTCGTARPSPGTASRPGSSTSCSPTRPTARAGRATWSAWAASPASRTCASWWSTAATPITR